MSYFVGLPIAEEAPSGTIRLITAPQGLGGGTGGAWVGLPSLQASSAVGALAQTLVVIALTDRLVQNK